MKTAITVILIIVAVAAVLFFLPLIIMFFSMYLVLIWTRTADYMNVSGVRMKAIIAQKSAGYTKSTKRDWQEWKRTKNRKDTYRNTPRENRRRKTERRASVETINTR